MFEVHSGYSSLPSYKMKARYALVVIDHEVYDVNLRLKLAQ